MLADGIVNNQTLTELYLTHNDLSLPNGIKIIKSLEGKKNLKSLALNSCRINKDLLEHLSLSLQSNDALKELYLYSNDIGPNEAHLVS